jgi:hypothetical protein
MKNEGLIHHRQSKVNENDGNAARTLAGVGFFVFVLTIQIWAAAAFGSFWLLDRWDVIELQPKWYELNLASAIFNTVRLWDRAMFRSSN